MAKGYMLFVEGMEPPKKVHRSIQSAWREMHRLASLNPGKEVMLLHLYKRINLMPGEEQAESIGSHLPPDTRGLVDKSELIRRAALKVAEKASKAEEPAA